MNDSKNMNDNIENTITQEEKDLIAKKKKIVRKKQVKVENLVVNRLIEMNINDLKNYAKEIGFKDIDINSLKKQEIIFLISKDQVNNKNGFIFAEGTLEILADGYGFLRNSRNSYLSSYYDIYISPSQIRRFSLKTGDTLYGEIRCPKDNERFFAMLKIDTVNDIDPSKAQNRVPFDSLIPIFPTEKFTLEDKNGDISNRMIDLFAPIGKGQRGLLVAPPKTGKTTIMQKIANAIIENNPGITLIILLIGERPEEVTDMQRSVLKAEVISSTFDEEAKRHVQVSEMALEKALRLVEHGKDVVIMLDSITRLARAYNQTVQTSGKILSGGIDSNALHKPKRFFGSARNIEDGASLTMIATALVDTGSRMDEVIFEEFKGTGNMELHLDRKLSERRIFPAINVNKSGTRREENLLKNKFELIRSLRQVSSDMDEVQFTSAIIKNMKETNNNNEFLTPLNFSKLAEHLGIMIKENS